MTQPPDRNIIHRVRCEIRLEKPCPECGSQTAVKIESGELVCKKCGLVLNRHSEM